MSYDIFFVRRDPGQTFEDALDEIEESFTDGDPGELTDADLENWEAIVPKAREIFGDVEVEEHDETGRELTATASGVELTLISGEIEIHVPYARARSDDSLELMSQVYELARAVEDVTGLEGYDPQVGEPVSDQPDAGTPRRRWESSDDNDDEDDLLAPEPSPARRSPATARGDMNPYDAGGSRRWWEFWKP